MNWTKTPPTKPGRYLWRISEASGDERLARVILEDGELFSSLSGKVWRHVSDVGGEWCGPMVSVEEVEIIQKRYEQCEKELGWALEQKNILASEVERAYHEGCDDAHINCHGLKVHKYTTSRARKIVEGEPV